jgi:hypothetical protein
MYSIQYGRTALHYAVMRCPDPLKVVRLLLQAGAQASVYDKAWKRPCDYAFEKGCFSLGQSLLHLGNPQVITVPDEAAPLPAPFVEEKAIVTVGGSTSRNGFVPPGEVCLCLTAL